jgi:hypothetical protein
MVTNVSLGLSVEERHVLGFGTSTVARNWRFAYAWLRRELSSVKET